MDEFVQTNNAVSSIVSQNYLLIKVDDKQKEFLEQFPKATAYPHIFVLGSDGTFLHSQGTGELEEGKGYNEEVFTSFLNKWKPAA